MIYPYEEKSEHGLPWHTTFIGQLMQHNYWLYNIVDQVMLNNPQIKSIVEIGENHFPYSFNPMDKNIDRSLDMLLDD